MARKFSLPTRKNNALKYLRVATDEQNVEWDEITSGDIPDFDESVDDRVSALIQDGSAITWTYDDGANTLTGDLDINSLGAGAISSDDFLVFYDVGDVNKKITFGDFEGTLSAENLATSLTAGSVVFSNGSHLSENNANFFWDNSNARLGIGTNTPSYPFEINTASPASTITMFGITNTNSSNNTSFDFRIGVPGNYDDYILFARSGTNVLSIDSSNECTFFTETNHTEPMKSVSSGSAFLDLYNSTTNLEMQSVNSMLMRANKNIRFYTNYFTERLTILQNGNIGIGIATPVALLDVRGSAIFNEGGLDVDFRIEGDNNANLFFLDASTDRIGIGTNTPQNLLDVVSASGVDGVGISNTTASKRFLLYIGDAGAFQLLDTNTSRYAMTVLTGGRMGINKTVPIATFHTQSLDATEISSVFQGYASQTSDLTQWRNSGGTILARIDAYGGAVFNETGADVDTRIEGNTEDYLFFVDAGNDEVRMGDGDTNYSVFNKIGDLVFVGTARINWTKIVANSVTLDAGTSTSTVSDLQTAFDGNTYDITEAAATPGIDLKVDFEEVTAFNWVQIIANYNGSATHSVSLQLYNWNTAAWDIFDSECGIEQTMTNHSFFVPSDTDYIGTGGDVGNVRVRFNHTQAGNVSHDLYIDVVALYQ